MSRSWGILLFASLFGLAQAAAAAPVRTEAGLVEGATQDGVMVYKGIPFAAPPVGDLRWRDAQPVTAWSGVRQADHFSPECMQTGAYPPDAPPEPMSEDCLYLNVWRPLDPAAPLPVMVWIYGGGVDNGSGAIPLYAGDALAKHGVIVVTFNYRLGVFGFLAHPELTRESPHHSSGDYGLLDQIAALRWVKRNIAAFGGDPRQVTVFGQSSGSISISALTASPLARDLFQRAIGESGGLFEPMELEPDLALPGAEQQGLGFAERAGVHSLQALRSKPAAELEKVDFGPALIVDGYAIPQTPFTVYREGRENPVSVLIGSNADEGRLFLSGDMQITAGNYAEKLGMQFPPLLVKLLAPAPGTTDLQAQAAAAQFNTDMRFRWDMWTWANLARHQADQKVFLYQFDRVPPYPAASRYAGLGATHGMEMAYVFGHLDPQAASWTTADQRLSAAMESYWTNFAKSGDPNGPGLPAWSPYTAAKPVVLYLGSEIAAGPVENEGNLRKIGHVYVTARFVLGHIYLVGAGAILLLLLVVTGLILFIRRIFKPRPTA